MKKFTTLIAISAIALCMFACTKNVTADLTVKQDRAKPFNEMPTWAQAAFTSNQTSSMEDSLLEANDFAQPVTLEQSQMIVDEVVRTLKFYGRPITDQTVFALIEGSLAEEEECRIRDEYFYEIQAYIRTEENIRTRTPFNNAVINYATFNIYFEILTNLNTTLPNGNQNSLDYFPTGFSAGRWTFSDLVRAGRALGNQNSVNLTDFNPDNLDFHYYPDNTPIYYSGWYFEMTYSEDITVDSTTYPGPFGTQDGSNFQYIYLNSTPVNEVFDDLPDIGQFPQFPLQDYTVAIPIEGLEEPIYILGSDLFT